MDNNNPLLIEKRLVTCFLDMFIWSGFVLASASSRFTVFSPFINVISWVLALTAAPHLLHRYFAGLLVGKQGLASVMLVLSGILLIVTPTVLMATSLAESANAMIDKMGSQSLTIPPPSPCVAALPITGERLSALWIRVSVDLPGLLSNHHSQIGGVAKQFFSISTSTGGGLIGFTTLFIVSGITMAWDTAGAISAQRVAIRTTDENKGMTLTRLCTSTIRAVAQGVTGVALIQVSLVGVTTLMASTPAVGIFPTLAPILDVVQVPVILMTAPIIALIWSLGTHSTGMDIFHIILTIVTGMADDVLKPPLLRRGVDVPMPVVLLGALGGMVSNDTPGVLLGAALPAIGYRILMTQVDEGQPALPQGRQPQGSVTLP